MASSASFAGPFLQQVSVVTQNYGVLGLGMGSCRNERNNNRYLKYYTRWGELTVLIAQLFGTTRTWISLPAGAMKMRLQKFVVYTAVGGAIYCALAIGFSLALAGLLSRVMDTFTSMTYLSLLFFSFVIIAFITVIVLLYNRITCNTGSEDIKRRRPGLRSVS